MKSYASLRYVKTKVKKKLNGPYPLRKEIIKNTPLIRYRSQAYVTLTHGNDVKLDETFTRTSHKYSLSAGTRTAHSTAQCWTIIQIEKVIEGRKYRQAGTSVMVIETYDVFGRLCSLYAQVHDMSTL